MRALVALLLLAGSALADGQAPRNVGYKFIPKATAPDNCDAPYLCLWMPSQGVFANQLVLRYNGTDSAFTSFANPLASTFLDGGYTHTLRTGAIDQGVWLKISAGDPTRYVDFYGTYHSNANPNGDGTYRDNVFIFGQNCAPGGGVVIAGRGATCIHFESIWDQLAGGVQPQTETHWTSTNINGVQTRFVSQTQSLLNVPTASFGQIQTGTALYVASTEISLRSGKDSNDPLSLSIQPTVTLLTTPTGYNSITVDEGSGGYMRLQSGSLAAGATRSQIYLDAAGTLTLTAKNSVMRFLGGADGSYLAYEHDTTQVRLFSPDGASHVNVDNNGPYLYAGGAAKLLVQNGQTITAQQIYPNTDLSYSVGQSGRRFKYVAARVASVGDLPPCDADLEGAKTTVHGTPSTERTCMNGSGDTYAWRVTFTAP